MIGHPLVLKKELAKAGGLRRYSALNDE